VFVDGRLNGGTSTYRANFFTLIVHICIMEKNYERSTSGSFVSNVIFHLPLSMAVFSPTSDKNTSRLVLSHLKVDW